MPISDEIFRELVDIEFRQFDMVLFFSDGGRATAPYWWYPRLQQATREQRQNWEMSGRGRGIHWPDLDEDLSVNGILSGLKAPGAKPPAQAAE